MELTPPYRKLLKRVVFIIGFCASIFLVTRIALQFGSIANAPTVGFSFLILVLLSAYFADLPVAIITSVVAGLCFNYFFLPPVGTFTIAEFDDWVSFAAFLLTAITISRLTSSAREKWNRAEMLERALARLQEFGVWLLSIPHDRLSLSGIATEVVRIFSADYCSIHVYREGKWHHFTGSAGKDISDEIASRLKLVDDHPTNLMELVDESSLGVRYMQIKQGNSAVALLVVKSTELPIEALGTLANMIGARLLEILHGEESLAS